MNDDKTRPRLSLRCKAPPADASVPASEAGADITVSRQKTVVVNTGPKRNKKPLADDRPPPGCSSRAKGNPKKQRKKQPALPPNKAVEVVPPPPKKKSRPGRPPRLLRPADAVQTLSTHWPGTAVVEAGNTPLSENADADGNVSERPDGRSRMLQRGWLC